jgi:hypothetical protein
MRLHEHQRIDRAKSMASVSHPGELMSQSVIGA